MFALSLVSSALSSFSAFLIGSIDEVNRKISKLDRKLQSYTDLVIESRASDREHELGLQINLQPPSSDRGREIYHRRGEPTALLWHEQLLSL